MCDSRVVFLPPGQTSYADCPVFNHKSSQQLCHMSLPFNFWRPTECRASLYRAIMGVFQGCTQVHQQPIAMLGMTFNITVTVTSKVLMKEPTTL